MPVLLLLALLAVAAPVPAFADPPNVVFVLVDDLRWDDIGAAGHPFARTPHIDRLAREGALFQNAFVTTPLCSPSRASFLTGQYARRHGIVDNTNRSAASHRLETYPLLLKKAGYDTAFVGKWHMGNDDSPRPGFDRWVSFKGQGRYLDPEISDGGEMRVVKGYITDILNAHAVDFVRAPRTRPFLLYLSHKAVHPNILQRDDGSTEAIGGEMFVPAERHRGLYTTVQMRRPESYGRPPAGKRALLRPIDGLPPLGAATVTDDATILGRQRALAAVDDGVGAILRALEETGQLDKTIVIFAGDNGYFYGEHGLSDERRLAYEPSARMPLAIRYPPLVRPQTTPAELVLNLDVAPTVLELAGLPIPAAMQGRSLVPLFRGSARGWRTSLVIEYFTDTVFPRVLTMGYEAVRTARWKYIRYRELEGMNELYDLEADPHEMKNLAGEGRHRAEVKRLTAELDRLVGS